MQSSTGVQAASRYSPDIDWALLLNSSKLPLASDEIVEKKSVLQAPRPRYGWHGVESYCKFPIGQRVYIGGISGISYTSYANPNSLIGEVIELGTVPDFLAVHTDLVHLRIVQSDGTYSVGNEDYWNEWQLYEVTND
jgi:hypothetical protein